MSTVNDEDGLQHVNQEMEAKVSAPFLSDRFLYRFLLYSLSFYIWTDMKNYLSKFF